MKDIIKLGRNIIQNKSFHHLTEYSYNLIVAFHRLGFDEKGRCTFSASELAKAMNVDPRDISKKVLDKEIGRLQELTKYEHKFWCDGVKYKKKVEMSLVITKERIEDDNRRYDKWRIRFHPDFLEFLENQWYNKIRAANYFQLGNGRKKNIRKLYLFLRSNSGRSKISYAEFFQVFDWKYEPKYFKAYKSKLKKIFETLQQEDRGHEQPAIYSYHFQLEYVLVEHNSKYLADAPKRINSAQIELQAK